MNSLSHTQSGFGKWKIAFVMFISICCSSANAVTIDEFLLLDKTLLLNSNLSSTTNTLSVRADFGRRGIRALGLRQDLGREMIRMGKEFSLFLRGRATGQDSFNKLFLRDARALSLRRDASTKLSLLSLRKSRQLNRGSYRLGFRQLGGTRETLLANYSILNKDLVWNVTDQSKNTVFAMSNFKSIPEPAGLLLFSSGLLGLALVIFFRPRSKKRLAS